MPQRITTKEFIKRAMQVHGKKFNYSEVKYVNAHTKVTIICPEHGKFLQRPNSHLKVHYPCKLCKKNIQKKQTEFSTFEISNKYFIEIARKIHGENYDYSKTNIEKKYEEVIIVCPIHKDFKQTPESHLKGQGSPKCLDKGERRIAAYFLESEINFVREFSIMYKRYDFFLPDFNLLIEFDGQQHYRNIYLTRKQSQNNSSIKTFLKVEEIKKNDSYKTKLAKKEGYKIARIPYWLTKDEEKIEIDNILEGNPTYPDVPDLKQEKTKPRPKIN